jgi:hypothetical protein
LTAAHTKAAKRRNRRERNAATRAAALKLKVPQDMGLVAAAELAVDEETEARERGAHEARERRRRAQQPPMERYKERGDVNAEQYAASERLYTAWASSGLDPWACNPSGVVIHGTPAEPGCGPSYAAYTAAVRAVGNILMPVLAHVVLMGESAGDWARRCKRPEREGIVALRLALDALVQHYRG